MRNPQLIDIDNALKTGTITLAEAYQCWKLVRRCVTAQKAVSIVKDRKVRKQEKLALKAKGEARKSNEKHTLEQLVQKQQRLVELIVNANRFSSEWADLDAPINNEDAMNYISGGIRTEEKFDSDLCYSNTNGSESLFS